MLRADAQYVLAERGTKQRDRAQIALQEPNELFAQLPIAGLRAQQRTQFAAVILAAAITCGSGQLADARCRKRADVAFERLCEVERIGLGQNFVEAMDHDSSFTRPGPGGGGPGAKPAST